MEQLANLPIGRQYFSSIRKDNAVYIDKTAYIYDLCRMADSAYFLSRPRRFGKSLTLDTIAELFMGNKALFEGLWIEDKWNWDDTYPVIRFSLDAVSHKDGVEAGLLEAVHNQARLHKVKIKATTSGSAFDALIEELAAKKGKQVVVLIDEYDKPIVDNIDPFDATKALQNRDILYGFYGILKNASKNIRFLMITGVSKLARVALFSSLNHLRDITLNPQFAGLCGYTQAELEHYFKPYLETMPPDTLEKMKTWYNGYSWDAATFVYNPFSVLNFFDQKRFSNYWFVTGIPLFLTRLMKKRFEYKLEETEVSDIIYDSFKLEQVEDLDIVSILLQTGFLTIKEITAYNTFILNYPNEEVKQSFNQFLLSEYTSISETVPHTANILQALDKDDVKKAIQIIHNLIQAIPDQNYVKNEEKFFHAIIHLIFSMIGTDVRSEVHTATGRLDTVVIRPHRIFLFEFKIDKTAQEALDYLKEKDYVAHFRQYNKPITAIGLTFSPKTKGISEWKEEEL